MRKFLTGISLFCIGILLSLQPLGAAGGWSLIKNSSGIKVYERAVPPNLMEYMGVTAIDAKMEIIGEVLRDVPSFNKWQSDCLGAQVEKKFDKNNMVIYMVLTPPLIDGRDIVLKNKTMYDWDNARLLITFQATDEVKIPLEKNRTRVKVMTGSYEMEYLGRTKTKFTYKLLVDPGGDIPKKMAYSVMSGYPYGTLKALKKISADPKYATLVKGSEDEARIEKNARSEAYVRKMIADRLSKHVKDKAALQAVMAANKDDIKEILNTTGSYPSVERASTNIYMKYMEKFIVNKDVAEKLKKDKNMIAEITEGIESFCGASYFTVDDIVKNYEKKYSR